MIGRGRAGGQDRPVPRWVLVSAGLSPVLVTGGWLVAGALQPPSYDPVRDTVSVMAGRAGTDPWVMTGALLAVGVCYFLTAAGLASLPVQARVLLAVAGLSSIGISASPEPVAGSTPQHLAWTALGAVTIMVWPAFTARRAPRRPLILRPSGAAVVTIVFAALVGWLVIETQGGSALGLAERLVGSMQTTWPFIVAAALRRSTPRTSPATAPGEPQPAFVAEPHAAGPRPGPRPAPAATAWAPDGRAGSGREAHR
jgi:hypothetical membrane protein